MQVRLLDLDHSLLAQHELHQRYQPAIVPLDKHGARIRLGCSFGRYRRFERAVANALGGEKDERPWATLYGSGDFHHVSLALVRRLREPINLVVFDNHPDWMRGVGIMHCGTWLYHAARLPHVRRIIHIGGDVDFDNYYRWLAPWPDLESGRIKVVSAIRQYTCGRWRRITHNCLRLKADIPSSADRWGEILEPFHDDLQRCSLYLSIDKDVMQAHEAPVNWDSGHLTLDEVRMGAQAFIRAAGGRLAGMDVVGDWSPVCVQGFLRRFMHLTEHPALTVNATIASQRNEQTNLALLSTCA